MATALQIELPQFLHLASLEREVEIRTKDALSKNNLTFEDTSTDPVMAVVMSETTRVLAEKDIRWVFGERKVSKLNPSEDELANVETVSDNVVASVNEAVGSAIFISTAALGVLLRKSS